MMLLTVLIAINVILNTYSICRWRSNLRLEAACRHLLPKPKLLKPAAGTAVLSLNTTNKKMAICPTRCYWPDL